MRRIWCGLVGMAIGCLGLGEGAIGQIVPDGTLGSQVTGGCDGAGVCNIINGSVRSGNLFHSFQQFSLPNQGTAQFTTLPTTENVIVRVTGVGQPFISNINGVISTNNPANFFLINPNGIQFGANAGLDIGGSFLATTAERMQFQDTTVLRTDDPAPLLTVSVPTGLQFGQTPQNIQMKGTFFSTINNKDAFADFILVGGNIFLDDTWIYTPGRRIELSSSDTLEAVSLSSSNDLRSSMNAVRKDISLINDSRLVVEFNRGGNIDLEGRNINILSSRVSAGMAGGIGVSDNQAGNLYLNALDTINIRQGSQLFNLVYDTGNGSAGDIDISARSLVVAENSVISASVGGTGNAGNLKINIRDIFKLDTNSRIFSIIFPGRSGKAQDIQINTGDLLIGNGSQISASTLGTGDAGDVLINAQGRIVVDGTNPSGQFPSFIRSSVGGRGFEDANGQGRNININTNSLTVSGGGYLGTFVFGNGNAGDININAKSKVVFDGSNSDGEFSGSAVSRLQVGTGSAGDIRITANELEMLNGGSLKTDTFGMGDAGSIFINISSLAIISGDNTTVDSRVRPDAKGDSGNISISSGDFVLADGAQIVAATLGGGNAGDVILNIRGSAILIGGNKTTGSDTLISSSLGANDFINAKGSGGDVKIFANTLDVANASIATSTFAIGDAGNLYIDIRDRATFVGEDTLVVARVEDTGVGKGGDIQITTNNLEVLNDAALNVSTLGNGNSGNIVIDARDQVLFDFSSAFSVARGENSNSIGEGGDIRITTKKLDVLNFSLISSSSLNSGDAGDVGILVNNLNVDGNSEISSFTRDGSGDAGDIIIDALDRISLNNSSITVKSETNGTAGDIIIASPQVRLDASFINAESSTVNGGNIIFNIRDVLLLRRESNISATAGITEASGDGGNIDIQSKFIVAVPNENSDIRANAFSGSGGKVLINTQGLFGITSLPKPNDRLSDITASSASGSQGTVTILEPDVRPEQGINELPTDLIDPNNQISKECPRGYTNRPMGSFIVTGKGGIPTNPIDISPPLTPLPPLISSNENPPVSPSPIEPSQNKQSMRNGTIVEAQGWYRNKDGRIHLVAKPQTRSIQPLSTAFPCVPNS